MAPIHKVVLAGAGSVGKALIQPLVDAGFELTVFSRDGSKTQLPSNVKTVTVDYNSIDNLKQALSGQDAVISTLVASALDPQQNNLIDASIAAGVKRFIPSEFGSDSENEKVKSLPVFEPKVKAAEYLEKQAKGTEMTYTYIITNAFLDYCVQIQFLIDLKGKKMEMIDGGEAPFTTTPLPFVAKGVVAVLQKPEETANRFVRLHGNRVTQKQLLEAGKKAVGGDGWEVTERKGSEVERGAYELLQKEPQNFFAWFGEFLKSAIMGQGYGGDFSGKNDNEVLGLKEMSEEDVEDLIKQYA